METGEFRGDRLVSTQPWIRNALVIARLHAPRRKSFTALTPFLKDTPYLIR